MGVVGFVVVKFLVLVCLYFAWCVWRDGHLHRLAESRGHADLWARSYALPLLYCKYKSLRDDVVWRKYRRIKFEQFLLFVLMVVLIFWN